MGLIVRKIIASQGLASGFRGSLTPLWKAIPYQVERMGAFCSLAQVTGVHRQFRDENDEIPVADALPCPDSLLDSLQRDPDGFRKRF